MGHAVLQEDEGPPYAIEGRGGVDSGPRPPAFLGPVDHEGEPEKEDEEGETPPDGECAEGCGGRTEGAEDRRDEEPCPSTIQDSPANELDREDGEQGANPEGDEEHTHEQVVRGEARGRLIPHLHGKPFHSVDQEGAHEGAPVVARAPDDDHDPDRECDGRCETGLGREVTERHRVKGSGQAHQRTSEGKGLELVAEGVLPQGHRRFLVLSDGPQDATPRRLRHELEDDQQGEEHEPANSDHRDRVEERGVRALEEDWWRNARDPNRAPGDVLRVPRHDLEGDGKGEGRNREVVRAKPQRRQGHDGRGATCCNHGEQHAHDERQREAAEVARIDDDVADDDRRRRRGDCDRRDVGADQVEPRDPGVEQAGVAPLEVETKRQHGKDDGDADVESEVCQDSFRSRARDDGRDDPDDDDTPYEAEHNELIQGEPPRLDGGTFLRRGRGHDLPASRSAATASDETGRSRRDRVMRSRKKALGAKTGFLPAMPHGRKIRTRIRMMNGTATL